MIKQILTILVATVALASTAEARKHEVSYNGLYAGAGVYDTGVKASARVGKTYVKAGVKRHRAYAKVGDNTYAVYSGGVGSRPSRWCGWYARTIFGGGPEYNVARNWAKRGVETEPKVGAVVVWPHHVGYISGKNEKGWIITSGNDGGKVRSRNRSLAGVIAIRDLS